MKSLLPIHACALACLVALSGTTLVHAADRSPAEESIASAAADGRYSFVLFHSRKDSATQTAYETVRTEASKFNGQVLPVHVGDRRESQLVERFDATRMPMPAVVALAPNGAVTGVFPLEVTAEQVTKAFVSPGYAECIKGLQDGKLVLLCVHPGETAGPAPAGVRRFAADPTFGRKTRVLHVGAASPQEVGFMKQLRVSNDSSAVVFMAPPGVMVGSFPASVSAETLTEKLVEADKCCTDPNCKHRQNAKRRASQRR